MNVLDFNIKAGWPGSTETWKFLQDMILQLQQLSLIGGANYIISGCNEAAGNVSDGWIVMGGEVMPFVGGPVQPNVIKVDTVQVREFFGGAFNPYYHTKTATFGSGIGQVDWTTFERTPVDGLLKAFRTHNHDYHNLLNKPAGYITHVGSANFGLLVGSVQYPYEDVFTVNIPNQVTTNYTVAGSLVSQSATQGGAAGWNWDNEVTWVVANKLPDSFQVGCKRIVNGGTPPHHANIRFEFSIIKAA